MANPFETEHATLWPTFKEDEEELLERLPAKPALKRTGLSQSRSAGNVTFTEPKSTEESTTDTTTTFVESQGGGLGGRRKRTGSLRYLDGLKEEVTLDDPPSPYKRSRSPMKKMFGDHGWLGRSMSLKELPVEQPRASTGFKNLGERIKKRVEHLASSRDVRSI